MLKFLFFAFLEWYRLNWAPLMSCYFPVKHPQDLRGKLPVNAPKSGLEVVLSRVDI